MSEGQKQKARPRIQADASGEEHKTRANTGDGASDRLKGQEDSAESAPAKRAWYRRPILVGLLILLIIGGAVGGVLWWSHSRKYESTQDAFVDIASEHVSPQVSGRVIRVLVNDNQDVRAGDVLVELDP